MPKPSRARPLPSRQEIVDFITKSPAPVGKREIVRAFKVGSADRVALKGLIKDIERSAVVERMPGRRLAKPDALPEMAVLQVTGLDSEGLPVIRPIGLAPEDESPVIHLSQSKGETALGVGDRAIMRLRARDDGDYDAVVVRRLAGGAERVLGVFTSGQDGGGTVTPADRRHRGGAYHVRPIERTGTLDGELVLCEPLPLLRLGLPHVQIIERLGRPDDPKSISLMAIHQEGIPVAFSDEALAQAAAARPVALSTREDLRHIPLITIDGADARDFDDAVFAERDPLDENGWHAIVAIADVAWYVRPGTPLDNAARTRGNSVYFPDRVVPMLPEALSNELCSLKPHVERACLAIHLWIDGRGRLQRHEAGRGLMRSAARLTYEQVQAAMDGSADEMTAPHFETSIKPLYGVFSALSKAREQRGTLELDLPEKRVLLGDEGRIAAIETRQRLDSHRLIEELMITANVAAAETLERVKVAGLYRIHDAPDPAKLEALSNFLEGLNVPKLKLAKGQAIKPKAFTEILSAAEGRPEAQMVSELVLRAQAQASYAPGNIGHFGLALRRYAHFTSPIRRYADLVVHRAVLCGLGLTERAEGQENDLQELGDHLSRTERRAAAAERAAIDRYMVLYLADRVGATFAGRINGVTRFGLFVTLAETGADGLIPISTLPADFYHHHADKHRLVGQRFGRVYTLGDVVKVRLAEVDKVRGSLLFALDGESDTGIAQRLSTGSRVKPAKPARVAKGATSARWQQKTLSTACAQLLKDTN